MDSHIHRWFIFKSMQNRIVQKNARAVSNIIGKIVRQYLKSNEKVDYKQYINFPGKEDIACFEPTYAIEDFYKNMLRSLGKESVICKTILNFLLSHNYLYSYDEKCCINLFPEKYAL